MADYNLKIENQMLRAQLEVIRNENEILPKVIVKKLDSVDLEFTVIVTFKNKRVHNFRHSLLDENTERFSLCKVVCLPKESIEFKAVVHLDKSEFESLDWENIARKRVVDTFDYRNKLQKCLDKFPDREYETEMFISFCNDGSNPKYNFVEKYDDPIWTYAEFINRRYI